MRLGTRLLLPLLVAGVMTVYGPWALGQRQNIQSAEARRASPAGSD